MYCPQAHSQLYNVWCTTLKIWEWPWGQGYCNKSISPFVLYALLHSGTATRRFVGHTKDILSVAFSVDNRQIVSAAYDHTIKLWNTLGVCKYTIQVDHYKSLSPEKNLLQYCIYMWWGKSNLLCGCREGDPVTDHITGVDTGFQERGVKAVYAREARAQKFWTRPQTD